MQLKVTSSPSTSRRPSKAGLASSPVVSSRGSKTAVASSPPASPRGSKLAVASSPPASPRGSKLGVTSSPPASPRGSKHGVARVTSSPAVFPRGSKLGVTSSPPASRRGSKAGITSSPTASPRGSKAGVGSSPAVPPRGKAGASFALRSPLPLGCGARETGYPAKPVSKSPRQANASPGARNPSPNTSLARQSITSKISAEVFEDDWAADIEVSEELSARPSLRDIMLDDFATGIEVEGAGSVWRSRVIVGTVDDPSISNDQTVIGVQAPPTLAVQLKIPSRAGTPAASSTSREPGESSVAQEATKGQLGMQLLAAALAGPTPERQGNLESGQFGMQLLAAAFSPANASLDSGTGLTITFANSSGEDETLQDLDPKSTIYDIKVMIHKTISWAPHEYSSRLILEGEVLQDCETLAGLGFEHLENPTLMVAHVPYCQKCGGECRCPKCHGQGSWSENEKKDGNGNSTWTCAECGMTRTGCTTCRGPCRCRLCHGNDAYCPRCGHRAGICWGGDTYVLLPANGFKQVRDCRVGNHVLTVKGPRRIARIWNTISDHPDTEVCCVDGVWMTSGHPVVMDGEWKFPAFLAESFPWTQVKHDVPDLYNFELEGHCDMVLLWAGGNWPLVVSCTIGKYLGPRFGFTYANLRSTRCAGSCAQCDVVHRPGIDFARVPASLRWAKQLPAFPQVEWDGADETDVELAEACKARFQPMSFRCRQATRLWFETTSVECPPIS